MKHWVSDYIGLPWVAYATGPAAYDCHGLVHKCLGDHYGISVDRYAQVITNDYAAIDSAVKAEQETGNWVQVSDPVDGAIVLMGSLKKWNHIGLWVDVNGGRCLHSRDGVGVGLDRLESLHDIAARVEFWIHKDLL